MNPTAACPTPATTDLIQRRKRRPVIAALVGGLISGVVAVGLPASRVAAQTPSPATVAAGPVAGTASDELRGLFESIRSKNSLPSLAGGFSVGTDVLEYAATGYRYWGSDVKVTDNDVYHLGSVTKSMTGTVIAKLVEQGVLNWETPLEKLLPGMPMRDEYKSVTLTMLMAHRAGFSGNTYPAGSGQVDLTGGPVTRDQRRAYIQNILNQPPTSTPGTKYEYSNPGTATAAFVAEEKTGKTIEQLATELVWQPLGMTSCSMGTQWPSTTSQPNPHQWVGGAPKPAPIGSGNSRLIDGADQGRCSIHDMVRYAMAHATGESLGGILRPESWTGLHTVRFPGQNYAAGWLLQSGVPGVDGVMLQHAGTNTFNYATVYFIPKSQIGIVVLTNIGASLPDRSITRTAAAEQEAARALLDLANRRLASRPATPPPTDATASTAPTTAAPTVPESTAPQSTVAPKGKKKCTVNPKTKKKVCR